MSSVKWWPFCSYISVLKWFLIGSICLLFGTYTWTSAVHDDDIKCKHFPCYCPFVRGIHRSPVDSPHKDQWRGALILSLICAWTNSWANNRNADDLRPHSAHYGVTLMLIVKISKLFWHLHKMKVSFKMHFFCASLYHCSQRNDFAHFADGYKWVRNLWQWPLLYTTDRLMLWHTQRIRTWVYYFKIYDVCHIIFMCIFRHEHDCISI